MSKVEFVTTQLDAFLHDVYNTLEKKYPKRARSFIRKESNRVKRDAENNTQTDTKEKTGLLQKSWKTKTKHNKKTSEVVGFVRNTAPHAHLVENGHEIILEKGGESHGFVEGKHMLERAVIKSKKDFHKRVEKMLDNTLEELSL